MNAIKCIPLLVIVINAAFAQRGADIAFILDGSGSVEQDNYDNGFLPFIQMVADRLPLSSDMYQIGIVSFGNEGEIQMNFNAADHQDDLRDEMENNPNIKFLNQNTNTSGGILVTRTELFGQDNHGARQDVARIAVLMTDGPATRGDPVPEANLAKAAGITMLVVGIQRPSTFQALDRQQLSEIASDPNEVVIVDDFPELRNNMAVYVDGLVDDIQTLAGEGGTTTTTTSTATTTPTTTTTRPDDLPTTTTTRRPDTTITPTRRPPSTTTEPQPQESQWTCEFENDEGNPTTCGMTSEGFRWLPRIGETPSARTGPRGAFSGDVYMYMEASRPRKPNDRAELFVPKRVFDGEQCVRFATQMTGENIGALQVVRMSGSGDEETLYEARGETQAGNWIERSLITSVGNDDKGIVFRGIVGDGYRGDIGLDYIRVSSGAC